MKKKKPSNKNRKGEYAEIMALSRDEELEKLRSEADAKEKSGEMSIMEEFEQSFSSNEPIRELFTAKNIKYKTQLTDEQRAAVSILYDTYKTLLTYGINVISLKNVLDEYIDFGVSVDRKGRAEYVEAHRSYMQQQNAQLNQQMNNPNNLNNMKM